MSTEIQAPEEQLLWEALKFTKKTGLWNRARVEEVIRKKEKNRAGQKTMG